MSKIATRVRGLGCAALLSAFCAAPTAQADTLGTIGYLAGSQSFELSIGGQNNGPSSPDAGGFSGTWNAASITFWCIELIQNFNFGKTYTEYSASLPDNATFTMLGQLFNEAYNTPGYNPTSSPGNSAAFQLAIWEIVYDGDLNLRSGNPGDFYVKSGNQTTIDNAQHLLDNLGGFADTYNIVMLTSADHQDFVTFGRPFRQLQVPEPGSLALLGLALIALVSVRQMRHARA